MGGTGNGRSSSKGTSGEPFAFFAGAGKHTGGPEKFNAAITSAPYIVHLLLDFGEREA
jgi:hypothetical protein